MAELWRSFDSSYLSDELRAGLRRRARELSGLAMLAGGAALGLALATWSSRDPSLTHATNGPVRNLLGFPGASAADVLMQLLGLAAVALVIPVAIWGWRLLSRRPLGRERLRVFAWLLGFLATATFASCLPATASWPLPSGLGGVLGDALLRLPEKLLGAPLGPFGRVVFASGAARVGDTDLDRALLAGRAARDRHQHCQPRRPHPHRPPPYARMPRRA
jgi:S-DNA-T family DNA segregation ATPase FtsK/SpoIIIE